MIFLSGRSMLLLGLPSGKEVDENRQDDTEQAVQGASRDKSINGRGQTKEDGKQGLLGIFSAITECIVICAHGFFETFSADDALAT